MIGSVVRSLVSRIYPVESGYLSLQEGHEVLVQHVGDKSDEMGWLYGQNKVTQLSGWVSRGDVTSEVPTRSSTPSEATPQGAPQCDTSSSENSTSADAVCPSESSAGRSSPRCLAERAQTSAGEQYERTDVAAPNSGLALGAAPCAESHAGAASSSAPPPSDDSSSSPFGDPSSAPFDEPSSSPFGDPSASPFGEPSASPFGEPSQSPFGEPPVGQPYGGAEFGSTTTSGVVPGAAHSAEVNNSENGAKSTLVGRTFEAVRGFQKIVKGELVDGYLVLYAGDNVTVDCVEDDWLYGTNADGYVGWFPRRCIKCDEEPKDLGMANPWAQCEASKYKYEDFAVNLEVADELPIPGFSDGWSKREELLHCVKKGIHNGSSLPMHKGAEDLLEKVARHRVVVVDAATGSGKSTLAPLYLTQQCMESDQKCRIVVTQPRRLAAKGLAKRVAEETGTKIGELAGYRVGSDRQDNGAPIVYVTAGHLLEALIHNPGYLDTFSHVVLDEVHERSIHADFLMTILRMMLSRPETMHVRIVVMSATMQPTLQNFFEPLLLPRPESSCVARISLPGNTPFPVEDYYWNDMIGMFPNIGHLFCGREAPNFESIAPQRLRDNERFGEELRGSVKKTIPIAVAIVAELRQRFQSGDQSKRIILAFLPGLEEIVEMKKQLDRKVYGAEIFMIHSQLEESTYRPALDVPPEREFRVVLATDMAESSLTIPGVSVVLDFGLHRREIYNDRTRMSVLGTEWCSQASMIQRRGRTGRTNPGIAIKLIPRSLFQELLLFDRSGVERSNITRVTLQAAHLAELLNQSLSIRFGLPVAIVGKLAGRGKVKWWSGGSWQVFVTEASHSDFAHRCEVYEDHQLIPQKVDARWVLGMLPTPVNAYRADNAIEELRQLGALCEAEAPTLLGRACLKLPLDVQLGRLVVLGWTIGLTPGAVVLASALAVSPVCDIFRTPWNPDKTMRSEECKTLSNTVDVRKWADRGDRSEPMAILKLCQEWLSKGGGDLGKAPQKCSSWSWLVQTRAWGEFSHNVIEVATSMQRLLGQTNQAYLEMNQLILSCQGCVPGSNPNFGTTEQLKYLLTIALAPGGFVAVGQSTAQYNDTSEFDGFVQNNGSTKENTFILNGVKAADAQIVIEKAYSPAAKDLESISEVQDQSWNDDKGGRTMTVVSMKPESNRAVSQMSLSTEFLWRIGGPFNGRKAAVEIWGHPAPIDFPKPHNPYSMDWYMPKRSCNGVLSVRPNWRSQIDSLLQTNRRRGPCRSKQFLIACGAETRSQAGQRTTCLRGSTVLTVDEDDGRKALLWLLAGGLQTHCPGQDDEQNGLVVLAAPTNIDDGQRETDFEVRGLRLWRRNFRMPVHAPITKSDLQLVNKFRCALEKFQNSEPSILSGDWYFQNGTRPAPSLRLERDRGASGADESCEKFMVQGYKSTLFIRKKPGKGNKWRIYNGAEKKLQEGSYEQGGFYWQDGTRWTRDPESFTPGPDAHVPLLTTVEESVVEELRSAGRALAELPALDSDASTTTENQKLPARLVPLRHAQGSDPGCPAIAEFDLDDIAKKMATFSRALPGVQLGSQLLNDDENENDAHGRDDLDDNVLWSRALEEHCTSAEAIKVQNSFVESKIALPPTIQCAQCGGEDKLYSKSQSGRPPDERVCKECVQKQVQQNNEHSSYIRPPKPPPREPHEVNRCCGCNVPLTRENCSSSQKKHVANKRRCQRCAPYAAT